MLKTAAVVALFFPLMILAVPALDATFVVAKRIKYRRPVYSADRWHFHHRFTNIGFSRARRCSTSTPGPFRSPPWRSPCASCPTPTTTAISTSGWTAVILAFAIVAFAASLYLVLVLEILKFRRFRERQLRRASETGEVPALSETEIRAEIEREVETGEFQAV